MIRRIRHLLAISALTVASILLGAGSMGVAVASAGAPGLSIAPQVDVPTPASPSPNSTGVETVPPDRPTTPPPPCGGGNGFYPSHGVIGFACTYVGPILLTGAYSSLPPTRLLQMWPGKGEDGVVDVYAPSGTSFTVLFDGKKVGGGVTTKPLNSGGFPGIRVRFPFSRSGTLTAVDGSGRRSVNTIAYKLQATPTYVHLGTADRGGGCYFSGAVTPGHKDEKVDLLWFDAHGRTHTMSTVRTDSHGRWLAHRVSVPTGHGFLLLHAAATTATAAGYSLPMPGNGGSRCGLPYLN